QLARNYLVPFKLAYYVPRDMGKPILPEGWKPKPTEDELRVEQIVPAFTTVSIDALVQHQSVTKPTFDPNRITSPQAPTPASMTDLGKRDAIESIRSLTFERVRISKDDKRIYGSVSADDIVEMLQSQYGIKVGKESVHMAHDGEPATQGFRDGGEPVRIRHIGNYKVNIRVGSNVEDVTLDVVVKEVSDLS
ncbi:hypothetical protein HK102_007102, partial [Quaeritorhiza haematococci]